ncbi:hypothetical protein DL764_009247 [Monosporascus ibericus]|uniref:Uncharacterized protein n=1 Tax=Monosporascus ibericus TaxID=155417 RepID=A0A4Q4SYJ3_9PEZI|nr:hypothetical protein DL764_009247 [Monosporascus ibericus]
MGKPRNSRAATRRVTELTLQPATEYLGQPTPSRLDRIKRFSREGSPDLSNLKGVLPPRAERLTQASGDEPSSLGRRKRRSALISSSKLIQEKKTATVHLEDDNPEEVKSMVEFLYHHDYPTSNHGENPVDGADLKVSCQNNIETETATIPPEESLPEPAEEEELAWDEWSLGVYRIYELELMFRYCGIPLGSVTKGGTIFNIRTSRAFGREAHNEGRLTRCPAAPVVYMT